MDVLNLVVMEGHAYLAHVDQELLNGIERDAGNTGHGSHGISLAEKVKDLSASLSV